jgi:biotin carboxyl carrier protein
LETHVRVGDRVSAGEPIATFAPWRGHPDRIAELRRRIVELRRLATQSKAYEGFLQSARKRLRALRRPGRSSALVAQQDGVLVELVDPPASVDSGDVIARTEAMTTMLEATGDGSLAELAFDAECSLDSGEGQSASCNVEGVEVTRGSTTVTVKAAVGPEPWVDDDPLWVVLDPPAAGPSLSQPSTTIQLSERLEPGTESEQ